MLILENQRGVSTKDFKNKLGIALKEADETSFWLDVIEETKIYDVPAKLRQDCEVIIRLYSFNYQKFIIHNLKNGKLKRNT